MQAEFQDQGNILHCSVQLSCHRNDPLLFQAFPDSLSQPRLLSLFCFHNAWRVLLLQSLSPRGMSPPLLARLPDLLTLCHGPGHLAGPPSTLLNKYMATYTVPTFPIFQILSKGKAKETLLPTLLVTNKMPKMKKICFLVLDGYLLKIG